MIGITGEKALDLRAHGDFQRSVSYTPLKVSMDMMWVEEGREKEHSERCVVSSPDVRRVLWRVSNARTAVYRRSAVRFGS